MSARAGQALVTLLILLAPFKMRAAGGGVLPGHVPATAASLLATGRLPGSQRLDLAIGLPLRNPEALTQLIQQIYDPASPHYRQYLTPEQFTAAFGPTAEDYQATIDFVTANGLTITGTHSNRVLLDVNAPVADIERAFHITLRVYEHPTENRSFYAPDREPSVDDSVPILDVSGLNNYALPRSLVHKSMSPQDAHGGRPALGSGPGSTYRGGDFRAAYASGVAAKGLGQAVGLLEFDGYYASDITSYETACAWPNVPLQNVLLDSFNGSPGNNNIEVALDIEVAIAMAPGLSKVIVYEAGPKGIPNDILNRMVSDNLAKQLSSSWSWSGGPNSTTDQIFQQMAAQGQSFFQASGDSDAYTTSIPTPCDNPYITVVGGTTLSTTGPGGSWTSETTWNWNNGTGTGGGISSSYPIPSWQQGISMVANHGSTTMRNLPDVALTADNVWVMYNNGTSGAVGGTSCAAPLWAGLTALINQQALANGKPVMGFINPAIYSIGKGAGYGAAFHDITTGNNTSSTSPNNYYAVTGLDVCTGWGTPIGSGLINALAGPAAPQIVSNSLALVTEACPNNAVDPGETVTMNFGLINTGSANTGNLVATLQASGGVTSPSAAQTFGALTAGGAAVTRPFTFTASGFCGGTLTATLQLQDGSSNLGTVSFTMQLGQKVTGISFSENFDGVTAPSLPGGWSSVAVSGTPANWVTSTTTPDTAPNSAFAADAGTAGEADLLSPPIAITSASAQLTFAHNYNLASHTSGHPRPTTTYYDGGVLEISIGGGAFAEILSAGGSFVTGGYNSTLATGTGNPLGGMQAWGGSSGGWVTTTVNLPAGAAGQNVQLRWAFGTGINTSVAVGWSVDAVSVQDTSFSCCSPDADLQVTQTAAPGSADVGQNLTYTLTITNRGPTSASSVTVTDTLPSGVTFVSASPGCVYSGGIVSCSLGTLASGTKTNLVVTVTPTTTGTITNSVTVTSTTSDPNNANNASSAALTVYVPPSISAEPTNQTAVVGGSASFYVTAGGSSPLSYQWTFGGGALSGATSSTLGLPNVQANQAGNYAVIVSNPGGSVTSTVATLTVLVPPSISAPPTNQTVMLGANTSFRVTASGSSPLGYQWLFNGTGLAGATASTLGLNNVQTNQAGGYCVIVTNSASAVTSVVAQLTVLVPPSITLQPTNQTMVLGDNVTFQGGASGSSPLSYQWFFGATALSGATTPSLGLLNIQTNQAGNYSFVVTNGAGAATSAVAQLTVLVPPTIASQPTNQTVTVGSTVSFQIMAGGSTPLSYQWWFNGTNAVGSNTNVFTMSNVQTAQAGNYTVLVTNATGSVTSSVASLAVGTAPAITQQPSTLTVDQGQSATFAVSASGDAPLGYEWRYNGQPLNGGTGSSYTLGAATSGNAGNYDAIVSNTYGAVTSVVAQLTVLVPPTITSQPTNQTVTAGSTVSFQITAAGSSPLSYQWWLNGTNAVGANTNVLSLDGVQLADAGTYSVVVSNAAGTTTSSGATLKIGMAPTITQQPSDLTVAQGQGATFTVAASGDGPVAYQWRFDGVPVNSSTNSSYTLTAAASTDAGGYDAIVSNPFGAVTSVVAQLTVVVPPTITSQPTNQTAAAGSTVSFAVTAAGSAPLSFQWWLNGTNAVGANANLLSLIGVQPADAGTYSVVVSNSAGTVTSSGAVLTLGAPPAVTQQPSDLAVVQGQDATFSVGASGDAPLGYQWRFNGAPLVGGTASSYTLIAATMTNVGGYDAIVSNAYGSITSVVAQLTVLLPPSITSSPTNETVVPGRSATFQVSAAGTEPLSYQWWFNGTNAVGTDTNTLVLSGVQSGQAGNYTVVVTNMGGSSASAPAVLTIFASPIIQNIAANGTNVAVSLPSVAGISYLLEYKNTLSDPAWTATSTWWPGTGATLTLLDTNSVVGTRFYRVHCQ
jgi:uncharacterized repeat protein (TIGR01451 family)